MIYIDCLSLLQRLYFSFAKTWNANLEQRLKPGVMEWLVEDYSKWFI